MCITTPPPLPQARIEHLKAVLTQERRDGMNAYKQAQLDALERKHAIRVAELGKQHKWAVDSQERKHAEARDALARDQLRECGAFTERLQHSLVTGGEAAENNLFACSCTDRYICPHNRVSMQQAQRRRINPYVLEVRIDYAM